MNDVAEHLRDAVLPDVPFRQWVVTVPVWLRFVILPRRELVSPVLSILLRVIFGHLRRKGRELGVKDGKGAAVTVEQRAGDGARLHWHLHLIVADGVFHRDEGDDTGPLAFQRVSGPTKEELAALLVLFKKRVLRLLRRRGFAPDEAEPEALADGDSGSLLFGWQAAGLQDRVALGPRAGWRVLRVGGHTVQLPHKATLPIS